MCSIDQLLTDIDHAIDPLTGESVVGLGIGFPALGDYARGVLDGERSLYPCVGGFPLRDHLASKYGVPTRMVTDANLFAMGVAQFGKGRGCDNILAVTMGTGIGVGLILNGRLEEGSRGIPDVLLGVLQASDQPLGAAGHHFLRLYGADGRTLGERAAAGDTDSRRALRTIGASMAVTIRRLASALPTLDAIILGGGVTRSWRFIAPTLRRSLLDCGLRPVLSRLRYPALAGGAALFEARVATRDVVESVPPSALGGSPK
jgi:glucokinase